jgi:hypothetical protein
MKSYKINDKIELSQHEDYFILKEDIPSGLHWTTIFTKRELLTLYYSIQEILTGEHIELPTKEKE